MSYAGYIRHLDRTGTVKRAVVDDFLSATYRRVVNAPGFLEFTLNADHSIIDTLAPFDMFEFYLKNDALGIPWHLDFEGIYRRKRLSTDDNGISNVAIYCPGQFSILNYRRIAFPAGVNLFSSFSSVAAETLAKRLVEYNTTTSATVGNGRIRNGDLSAGMGMTIVVAADTASGNVISKSFKGRKVGDAISEVVAPIAGGDFSLSRVPLGAIKARWVFEFHLGQLGDDKTTGSDRVEFSLSRGNMRNPYLEESHLDEETLAISAGRGQGSDRDFQLIPGPDYAADNDIELWIDARNEATASGVYDSGSVAVEDARFDPSLDFDIIQTPAVFYSRVPVSGRKTYTLGDLVVAVYGGTTYERKVSAVTVNITPPSNEAAVSIAVETERT